MNIRSEDVRVTVCCRTIRSQVPFTIRGEDGPHPLPLFERLVWIKMSWDEDEITLHVMETKYFALLFIHLLYMTIHLAR